MIDEEQVKVWLFEKITVFRDTLRQTNEQLRAANHFRLWTTGVFSPDALTLLIDSASKTKKCTVEFKDADQVYQEVLALNDTGFTSLYKKHFR